MSIIDDFMRGVEMCPGSGDAIFCLDLAVDTDVICMQIEERMLEPISDINAPIIINYCKVEQATPPTPSISPINIKNLQSGVITEFSVTCTINGVTDIPLPTVQMTSPLVKEINNVVGSANTGTIYMQGSSGTIVILNYDPYTSSWINYNPNHNMATLLDNINCTLGEVSHHQIYVELKNPSIVANAVYSANDVSMVIVNNAQIMDESSVGTVSIINYIWIPITVLASVCILCTSLVLIYIIIRAIINKKKVSHTTSETIPSTKSVKKYSLHKSKIQRRKRRNVVPNIIVCEQVV